MNRVFDSQNMTGAWKDKIKIKPADIMLVNMPFADVRMPSLALGLLHSVLEKNGIAAHCIYANLLFAQQVGYWDYQKLAMLSCLPDWSFSSSAFPEFSPDLDNALKALYAETGKHYCDNFEDFCRELNDIRRQAELFVTELAQQIIDLSPRIVGCTSSINQQVSSLALLKKIHQLDNRIVTILGGADYAGIMGYTAHKQFPWIDFVVSGEAEDLIRPLVNMIFKYGREVPQEALPDGVLTPTERSAGYCTISGNSENNRHAVAHSFTDQSIPLYHDYFDTLEVLPALRREIRPILPIQSSRGCWYGNCRFCALNPPQIPFRSRPAQSVLDELDELYRTYGVAHFEFLDNILNISYFNDLIPKLIHCGSPYTIFYELRADMSKKQFELLRNAGILRCQMGIESLHTEALKTMRKGVFAWQNIQALKWCRQFGIDPNWNILYDFPGDKDEWYQKMADIVPLLTHLRPPTTIRYIKLQRNSHYFKEAKEYDLDLTPPPLLSYIFPLEKEALANLTYTFEDPFLTAKREDPTLAVLFSRPGLQNLRKETILWAQAAGKGEGPVLSMKLDGNDLTVNDTRPNGVAPSFRLSGCKKELYILCDSAKKEHEIIHQLKRQGFGEKEIVNAVEALLRDKLVIRIDGRLLALAVYEPYLEYLSEEKSPLGRK